MLLVDVPSFAVPPPLPKARPPSKIQPTQPTDVYQDIEFADQADAENIFTNALVDKVRNFLNSCSIQWGLKMFCINVVIELNWIEYI